MIKRGRGNFSQSFPFINCNLKLQVLADQLTLFQPGRADYPHLLLLAPPKFFTFRHHCPHWGVRSNQIICGQTVNRISKTDNNAIFNAYGHIKSRWAIAHSAPKPLSHLTQIDFCYSRLLQLGNLAQKMLHLTTIVFDQFQFKPHRLRIRFYVNFLGHLSSNGFQLKTLFGTHSN